MKVTFKTITQEMFQLSINEDQTILEVKNAIAKSRGENSCPVERQKLIYGGKVLDDSDTFDSLDYDGKKFIVIVLKPAPKVVEEEDDEEEGNESTTEISSTATSSTSSTSSKSNVSSTVTALAPSTSNASASSSSHAIAGPLTPENQEKLKNLIAMGYPEVQSLAALRAAYFNQPRAVEYLINGIPNTVTGSQTQHKSSAASRSSSTSSASSSSSSNEETGLYFLRNNAAFGQIRKMVHDNPKILPEVMQKIADLNKPLMAAIRENEAEFLELLNADTGAPASSGTRQVNGRTVREHVVDVTQEEQDAINRLKAMGFPEQLVIEAYIACDKNEELAVNYIIARMNEFHL